MDWKNYGTELSRKFFVAYGKESLNIQEFNV